MNSGTQTNNSQEINTLLAFREVFKTSLKKKFTVNLIGQRKVIDCEFNKAVDEAFSLTDGIILDKISATMNERGK
jgi:hypothetical protein